MLRLISIVVIYLQSVLFCRYAGLLHKTMVQAVARRQQLLLDPDNLLTGDFCQQAAHSRGLACSIYLQHRRGDQWLDSCDEQDLRHNHIARYWLLTTECRITFLFYRQRIFLFQQKIYR